MFGLAGCASRSALPSPPGSGSTWCCPYSAAARRGTRAARSRSSRACARAASRTDAVQPFDHLRARRAEPQQEAVAGERRERQRRHRGHRRCARADLQDPAAEHEPSRLRARDRRGSRPRRSPTPPRSRPNRRRASPPRRRTRRSAQTRAVSRRGSADCRSRSSPRLSQRALEKRQVVDAEVQLAAEEDRGAPNTPRAIASSVFARSASFTAPDIGALGELRGVETRAPTARRPRPRRRRGRGPSPRTRDRARRGTLEHARLLCGDRGAHQSERVDRKVRVHRDRDTDAATPCGSSRPRRRRASPPRAPASATGCRSP